MPRVALPKNAYPIVRVATEFYMRGSDVLGYAQSDHLIDGYIFLTLWHAALGATGKSDRSIGVRELARRLAMPYETVRRHSQSLIEAGQCIATEQGLGVPAPLLRTPRSARLMQRSYLNAERFLKDLRRIGVLKPFGTLDAPRHRIAIARAGMAILLAGFRATTASTGGDLLRGLIETAIWSANVKHITTADAAAFAPLLSDDQRQPVSVMAIADSLRQPYETVRRHANILVENKVCKRIGRRGLIMPAEVHRARADTTLIVCQLTADFVRQLQRAGVKIERA